MSDIKKCIGHVSPVEYGPIPRIRHVQGVCLMYKSTGHVSPVEYGPILRIRHVHSVCLMYKSVQGRYHRLNMTQ